LPVPGKGIGIDMLAPCEHGRDNVAAKVMLGGGTVSFGGPSVLEEHASQGVAIEHVDAHRTEIAAWLCRFLLKRDESSFGIRFQNAKAGTLIYGYDRCTKGDIRYALLMVRGN